MRSSVRPMGSASRSCRRGAVVVFLWPSHRPIQGGAILTRPFSHGFSAAPPGGAWMRIVQRFLFRGTAHHRADGPHLELPAEFLAAQRALGADPSGRLAILGLGNAGVKRVPLPPRSPWLNAFAERWVQVARWTAEVLPPQGRIKTNVQRERLELSISSAQRRGPMWHS